MMARDGVRHEVDQPDARPGAAHEHEGSTARGGEARFDADLRTLLSRLATQIADSDRRHGAALRDLQTRLGNLTERGAEAAPAGSEECSHSFASIQSQLLELAQHLRETRDRIESGHFIAPAMAAVGVMPQTSSAADHSVTALDTVSEAGWPDEEPTPSLTEEDESPMPEADRAGAVGSLDEIYASIRAALAEDDGTMHPVAPGTPVLLAAAPADTAAQAPSHLDASASDDDRFETDESAGDESSTPQDSSVPAPEAVFVGWNDNANWDEETAEALAKAYAETERPAQQATRPRLQVVAATLPVQTEAAAAEPLAAAPLMASPAPTPSPVDVLAVSAPVPVGIDEEALAERLDALAADIERSIANAVPAGIIEGLSDRIDALDAKVVTLQNSGGNDEMVAAIEAHIADMLGQIDRIGAGSERIEQIEEGIARLYDEVSGTRSELPGLIEQALAGTTAGIGASAMATDTAHEKLDALHELVLALAESNRARSEGESSDLQMVNAALLELVHRIDELEAIAAGDPGYDYVEDEGAAPAGDVYTAPSQVAAQVSDEFAQHDTGTGEFEYDEEVEPVEEEHVPARGRMRPAAAPQEAAPAQPRVHITDRAHVQAEEAAPAGEIQRLRQRMTSRIASEQAEQAASQAASEGNRVRISGQDFLAAARRVARSAQEQIAGGSGAAPAASAAPAVPRASTTSQMRAKQAAKSSGGLFSLGRFSPRPVLLVAIVVLLSVGAGLVYSKINNRNAPSTTAAETSAPAPVNPSAGAAPSGQLAPTSGSIGSGRESSLANGRRLVGDDRSIDLGASPFGIVVDHGTGGDIGKADIDRPLIAPATGASADVGTLDRAMVQPAAIDAETRQGVGDLASLAAGVSALKLPPEGAGTLEERLMAAEGDPKAQFIVASRLATGALGVRDEQQAIAWYQRAAAASYAPAQYRLGTHFERGRGVAKDLARARVWYERAASVGHVKSMHNLAVLVAGDSQGEPNYITAAQWFEKAADHGLADSQFNLAILYQNGLGVARNYIQAYKWFEIAAAGGDTSAAKRRDALGAEIAPQAMAAAKAQAASWRPQSIDPAVNYDDMVVAARADAAAPAPAPTVIASIAPVGQATTTAPAPAAIAPRTDPMVAEAQRLLKKLGYEPGVADGQMGPQTAAALRRFEARIGLVPTGRLSPTILDRLRQAAG